MKKISDIKVIFYPAGMEEDDTVKKFLKLKNIEKISYLDDKDLNSRLDIFHKAGYGSKSVLILKNFKGRLFQKCPGSPGMVCCNYLLINTCFDCLYDCTYCFLNFYKNSYGITQFINLDQALMEIDTFLAGAPESIHRIGTGEFTDSLMYDEITGFGASVISHMSKYKNVMIELKTKSDNVDHLLNINHKGNAIIAWSLNTERNIEQYEAGTASLPRRIDAAARCSEAGYFLAFHFDPIIIYDGYMNEYLKIVDMIFSRVDPKKIVWISMGCFRHAAVMKDILTEKFPGETLTLEEMFPGRDGKLRYLKKNRVASYRALADKIKSYSGEPFVYLCMETADVWEESIGIRYESSDELGEAFAEHMRRIFLN